MTTWKAILAVLLIFLAGAIFGGLASVRIAPIWHLLNLPSRNAVVKRINERLAYRLSLTQEQRQEVAGIIADSQKELLQLKKEVEPRVRDAMLKAQQKIRQQLTPEQQVKFDRYVQEGWERLDKSQLLLR
jgi:Spy/CpxP family protein refolding chaperone